MARWTLEQVGRLGQAQPVLEYCFRGCEERLPRT
jgi:hypothetical protein